MDNLLTILSNPALIKIIEGYWKNDEKKQEVAYNVFNLSSYNNQLENFHSDIIASFLNPYDLHNEGNIFLMEFISYLNDAFALKIDKAWFDNAKVFREKGRLDILIYDEESHSAIIVENKINDAPDMDDQLIRYYDYCNVRNYKVLSIIYLSKDGLKQAPYFNEGIRLLTRNVAAFSDSMKDLVNGWLGRCKKIAQEEDASSMLYQYIKLIKYLSSKQFDMTTNKEFYEHVSQNNLLQIANELQQRLNSLPNYRRDRFVGYIKDFYPFKSSNKGFNSNMVLYTKYVDGIYSYKIDVTFNEDGSASVLFWIPDYYDKDESSIAVRNKLISIGLLSEFDEDVNPYKVIIYIRRISFSDKYKTLEEIDNAAIELVQKLIQGLKNLNHE